MNKLAVWIGGWVALAESLVTICTLGRVVPSWELRYYAWIVLRGTAQHE